MSRFFALAKEKITDLINKGAFHIVIGSFMTKFVSFFGSIFVVRLMSKSEYGILSYYENFTGYFLIAAGFGLDAALLRYMVLAEEMPEKKGCYLHAVKRGTIWNIFLVAVGLLVLYFYPHKEAFQGQFLVAAFLALCMPFVFFINTGLNTMRGLFQNKSYAFFSFGISSFLIVSRILGAVLGGLRGVVTLRLLSEILCAGACVLYLYKKFFSAVPTQNLEKQMSRGMDSFSVQMMLTNGLWAVFMLNDLFLLGQLSGNEIIIADYKVAYVIPANLSILTVAVGIFVSPYFTKNDKEGNYRWIKQKSLLVLLITMGIMGFFVLLCFLLAKPIILLLYGESYLSAVPIMKLLLIASFFNNGVRATLANILSSVGRQKINLAIAGAGMAIQILLDVLLIPRYGGTGIAISSSFVYLMMSTLLVLYYVFVYFRQMNEKSQLIETEN